MNNLKKKLGGIFFFNKRIQKNKTPIHKLKEVKGLNTENTKHC